jgi:hypothetical protein
MSHYCGIDLHSNNHFVVVTDEEDKRMFEKRLNNDLSVTLEALSPYRESLQGIAVESTFNWYWLVDGLQENGYDVRKSRNDLKRSGDMAAGAGFHYCLGLLAEAQCELGQIQQAQAPVAEALSLVAQTREGWYESELYRLQGELLLLPGADQRDAEQSFLQSLEIARKQQALLLELHAAVALSHLWIEQGRTMEVAELLQPIIARFDDDSDDSDLEQARKLVVVNC